jgi:hypothetical protein
MVAGMSSLERLLRLHNRTMIGFDLALGSGALLKPSETLRVLGHDKPRPETEELFRRLGPIWLTFAAAHAAAALRDEPRDWWALAWLRGTELVTDVLWSQSPAFSRPGARLGMWAAGAGNLAMALGFAALSGRRRQLKNRNVLALAWLGGRGGALFAERSHAGEEDLERRGQRVVGDRTRVQRALH